MVGRVRFVASALASLTRVTGSHQEAVLQAPLLETKLYRPRAPRGLVPRPRLSDRLDRGTASKLTLISAPAGFGKTTVLADWLAARPSSETALAWLSLDRDDNNPRTFWTYLVSALRTAAPDLGASALGLLEAAQPPPIQTTLTTLVNDVAAAAKDIVLVLDDYHVIDAIEVQEGMAFLLDHLPPRLHLVIVTRADPALPLARLRARGELVEARAADLRFTADEAAAYLNGVMDLRPDGVGHGRPRGANRRLDRGASIGGAVDARSKRCCRLHRRLCG